MKTFLLLNLIITCSILNAQSTWTGSTSSDWGTASNWTENCVPLPGSSVVISAVKKSPEMSMDRFVGDITILPGATLNLGSKKITVYGDFNNNGNVITTTGSTVIFSGWDTQSIYGTHTFNNLEINNSNGVNIESGITSMSGCLKLISGTFDTNNSLVLLSDSIATASIMEIPLGANISGDVEIQRFVSSSASNWHFLSLPVDGASFSDWDDDLITTGIIGSDYPNWPSVENPWSSINRYNESDTGHQDLGFFSPSSMSEIINAGEGFWVWSGDTVTGDQPFLLDVKGPILKGDINLPVTYTNSGNLNGDGWNMVGNPYPSTIDWDNSEWVKNKIEDAIYIYDPENLQYASYVSGVPNNGGSQYISSSQAFWVKASGSNPNLMAKEAVKSVKDTSFFKQSSLPFNISVQKEQYKDQISFSVNSNASVNYDPSYDAYKIYSSSFDVPSICSYSNDNQELSINSFYGVESTTIPIKITAHSSGIVNLTFNNVETLNSYNCIYLEDKHAGVMIDLYNSSEYSFYLLSSTDTSRFLLHLNTVVSNFSSVDTVLISNNFGEYSPLNSSINGANYSWDFGDGNLSSEFNPIHNYSSEGSYVVTLTTSNLQGCTNVKTREVMVVNDIVTSINLFSIQEFEVYPNPASLGGVLNLKLRDSGKFNLEIFDLIGKKVFEKEVKQKLSTIVLDDSFNCGVYFMRLRNMNNQEVTSFKLSLVR